MVEYRKFKLKNEKNIEYDMTTKNAFFNSPSGLGLQLTYNKISKDGDSVVIDRDISDQTISFNYIFGGDIYNPKDAYTEYYNFVKYLSASKKLILIYEYLDKKFYRDVIIQSLPKTDKNIFDTLEGSLDLECTSLWYTEDYLYTQMYLEGTGKVYSTKTYPYTYTGIGGNVYVFNVPYNLLTKGSGFIISVKNISTNNYSGNVGFKIFEIENTDVPKYDVTINKGILINETMIFDYTSISPKIYIKEQGVSQVIDILNYSSINSNIDVKLPPGQGFIKFIDTINAAINNKQIELSIYWRNERVGV